MIEEDRIVLIAGAGILPEEFVKSHIHTCASGIYSKLSRLDAFKWVIVEDQPIGVTTHLIGEYVDAGEVIERREIPVYSSDTFHALAQQYTKNEVSMYNKQ